MRESTKEIRVKLEAHAPDTGEIFNIEGLSTESNKYYSIKKLNKRICIMDLFTMQEKICNSSKDINIFKYILYETNRENIFNKNITKFSKSIEMPRSTVSRILKKFVDVGLAIRIDRGEYLINPFAFQAKGSTNALIEIAQFNYSDYEKNKSKEQNQCKS